MKNTVPTKTNAARLLDSLGISYELRPYEVDPDDLTAISVARKIGLPPEQVFKTLLTHTNTGEHLFAVVPGDAELDLKKLAQAANSEEGRTRLPQRSRAAYRIHPRRGHRHGRKETLSRLR